MRVVPAGQRQATPRFRAIGLNSLGALPQLRRLDPELSFAMRVVGHVLPFKVNNYVVEELIDWSAVPDDPMFRLTFPQPGMLLPQHFERMAQLLRNGAPPAEQRRAADAIRHELNPNPAGQKQLNVPIFRDERLQGVQHKYRETILLFPREGQTCHAYCTFCFRWSQFVGDRELRFATTDIAAVVSYLRHHPEVSDVLITGGDPLTMQAAALERYLHALTEARLPGLQTIRIGTRVLSYWPYRLLTDPDAEDLLRALQRVTDRGYHLALMAHINHKAELAPAPAQEAIARLRAAGCEIRAQAPVMRGINDSAEVWASLLREQVRLGIVPYYMFVERDTGAREYFAVPLARALDIYRDAIRRVSGLARTLRGPSMSTTPGKIQLLDIREVAGEQVFVLRFLQARDPSWVGKVFFARFDPEATWLDDLRPAFGAERFFFE